MKPKQSTAASLIATGLGLYAAKKIASIRRRRHLRNKVALITGGSSGLGFALARRFLSLGANVIICSRDEDHLYAAGERLAREGYSSDRFLTLTCDISSTEAVDVLVEDVRAEFGNIDYLINNAGIIQVGPEYTISPESFREAMDINYWGMVNSCRAWLPYMQRGSHIINITSLGGVLPVPRMLSYTASKHAALGYSEGLAIEMKPYGIAVTTVIPGLMRTGSHFNAEYFGDVEHEYSWFAASSGLPGLSTDARKAAENIVDGAAARKTRVYVGATTRIVHLAHAAFGASSFYVLSKINEYLTTITTIGQPIDSGTRGENIEHRSLLLPFVAEALDQARDSYQPQLATEH